jgi:hypothetical protein
VRFENRRHPDDGSTDPRMKSRLLLRVAMHMTAIGIAIYILFSLFLMNQGLSARQAFAHVSVTYVLFLVTGIACAIAAVWFRRSGR